MKVAVTYEDGKVFQHFGHTEQFKIYTVENGTVQASEIVSSVDSGHGAISGFLQKQNVNALICGGIGSGARTALQEAGIQLYPGVTGDADACVKALLSNTLTFNPKTVCHHHHDEPGHDCASHHCGGHNHHGHGHGHGQGCGANKHGCMGNH